MPGDVERLRIMNAEANTVAQLERKRRCGPRHPVAVRIEGVDLDSAAGDKPRQPPLAAADLEHAPAVQIRDRGDRRWLSAPRASRTCTTGTIRESPALAEPPGSLAVRPVVCAPLSTDPARAATRGRCSPGNA